MRVFFDAVHAVDRHVCLCYVHSRCAQYACHLFLSVTDMHVQMVINSIAKMVINSIAKMVIDSIAKMVIDSIAKTFEDVM